MAKRPLTPDARRRDKFAAGLAVTLADGQTWELAPPVLGWGFTRGEDGATRLNPRTVDDYAAALDRFLEAEEPGAMVCALTDCAYALLSHNYDVTFAEAGSSLFFRADPRSPAAAASQQLWSTIAAWVVGDRPKATPDGSAPA
jgi:hypothetical protein